MIQKIIKRELAAFVNENILEEAKGAIERAYRNTGVNLQETFDGFLSLAKVIILPKVYKNEYRCFTSIKGNGDKAVVATAAKFGLIVCTKDSLDFKKASKYDVEVVGPGYFVKPRAIVDFSTFMFGHFPLPNQGTFYIRQILNSPTKSPTKLCLFDSENIGALYLDPTDISLKYCVEDGPEVAMSLGEISDNFIEKIIVSYDCTRGIEMYFGEDGPRSSFETTWTSNAPRPGDKTHFGSHRSGQFHINGGHSGFAAYPRRYSKKACNAILRDDGPPSAWSRLSLEEAINFLYR